MVGVHVIVSCASHQTITADVPCSPGVVRVSSGHFLTHPTITIFGNCNYPERSRNAFRTPDMESRWCEHPEVSGSKGGEEKKKSRKNRGSSTGRSLLADFFFFFFFFSHSSFLSLLRSDLLLLLLLLLLSPTSDPQASVLCSQGSGLRRVLLVRPQPYTHEFHLTQGDTTTTTCS